MNSKEINQLVKDTPPRCGRNDTMEGGRYVIWLENPLRTVKGNSKIELRKNLMTDLKLRKA